MPPTEAQCGRGDEKQGDCMLLAVSHFDVIFLLFSHIFNDPLPKLFSLTIIGILIMVFYNTTCIQNSNLFRFECHVVRIIRWYTAVRHQCGGKIAPQSAVVGPRNASQP